MSANTRSAAFQHVLSILNFGQDIKDYLKELVRVSDTDITDLIDESGGIFKLGHGKTIQSFKNWITDYLSDNDNTLPND